MPFEPQVVEPDLVFYHDHGFGVKRWDRSQKLGLGIEDTMRHYAVFEADLFRGKIIRRNVCTAVGVSVINSEETFNLPSSTHPAKG
ncbi:MAG TPA: hypothetical protein EYG65_05965 [Rhodospirillales bacterium]|nr:hypothetical protein [Rhodospirillales bacterium]